MFELLIKLLRYVCTEERKRSSKKINLFSILLCQVCFLFINYSISSQIIDIILFERFKVQRRDSSLLKAFAVINIPVEAAEFGRSYRRRRVCCSAS